MNNKKNVILVSMLAASAYVGSYFALMRSGLAVDFTKQEVVAPTYSAFAKFRRDPTASTPVYQPESSWLNSVFYPLDRLFRAEAYRNIAQQNDETAQWNATRNQE